MTKNLQNPEDTLDPEKHLEHFIGRRCKTKDTDDFPDLKEDGRCLTCMIYELIDQNYISKDRVIKAIGYDEGVSSNVYAPDILPRNQLRAEIRKELNL